MPEVQYLGFQTLRSDVSVDIGQRVQAFQFPGLLNERRIMRLSCRCGFAKVTAKAPIMGGSIAQARFLIGDTSAQSFTLSAESYPVPPGVCIIRTGAGFSYPISFEKPANITSVNIYIVLERVPAPGVELEDSATFLGATSEPSEREWGCCLEDLGPI